MKWDGPIAFFSDVHGCPDALEAVLNSISVQGVSQMIFLGDVLGYGPNPAECVRRLRAKADVCLLGNHDAMAVDDGFDLTVFPDEISIPLERARRELAPDEKEWLAGLPLTWSGEGIQASHASLGDPRLFIHVDSSERARQHFSQQNSPLSFFGHTHIPVVYGQDRRGGLRMAPGMEGEIRLNGSERYAVGVGSVGFPRDGDPRACWVEFRPDIPSVIFHRVEFDVESIEFRTAEMLAREQPPSATIK